MNKSRTVFVALGVSFILLFISLFSYFSYPHYPAVFWDYWHRDEYSKADQLSTYLQVHNIYKRNISCWDIGSRCGVILIFSSNLSFSDLKDKINNLGYEEKLSSDSDGNSVYTILGTDSGKKVEVNEVELNIEHYLQKNKYDGWSWWLVDNDKQNYSIEIFDLSSLNQELKVDGELLNKNLVSITIYTKGK